jgi:toxin ParE1/3/4
MARRIIWSQSARNDLDSIYHYLRRGSPRYAKRFILKAREGAQSLKQFPNRGRIIPEYPESPVREIFIDSYRMMYRLVFDSIEIVGLIHMSRDFLRMGSD